MPSSDHGTCRSSLFSVSLPLASVHHLPMPCPHRRPRGTAAAFGAVRLVNFNTGAIR